MRRWHKKAVLAKNDPYHIHRRTAHECSEAAGVAVQNLAAVRRNIEAMKAIRAETFDWEPFIKANS